MIFQKEEGIEKFIEEALPLFHDHWLEIARFKDIPLEIDRSFYLKLEEMGSLRTFTMRSEGKLVGYGLFVLRYNPHYKSCLEAHQDILFLKKEMRGSLSGYKFIHWCDAELQKEAVQVVYHHVKTDHNFGKLLERQGYQAVDIIYKKRL